MSFAIRQTEIATPTKHSILLFPALLVGSILVISGCSVLMPMEPGAVGTMTSDQKKIAHIQANDENIKVCDRNKGGLRIAQTCQKDYIDCKRLRVKTFENSSGTISERYVLANQRFGICVKNNVPQKEGGLS